MSRTLPLHPPLKSKKKRPQDATMRNVRAAHKHISELKSWIDTLQSRVSRQEETVLTLRLDLVKVKTRIGLI